jgi:hypothetical protein
MMVMKKTMKNTMKNITLVKLSFCLPAILGLLLVVDDSALSDSHRYDDTPEDENSPFYDFKQNGVETFCTVPSLGDSPSFGVSELSPEEVATVSDEEAAEAYECVKSDMQDGYAKSGHRLAGEYMSWQRFSSGPYQSKAHMRRYVNNYANDIAAPFYGKYEQSGRLPEGSVLAKDSFMISKDGRVIYSSLAIMEKMPQGFNPGAGDWRFTLVLPDGRLFGSTHADDEYTVEFCQKCHEDAGADHDFLFFMPNKYRTGTD